MSEETWDAFDMQRNYVELVESRGENLVEMLRNACTPFGDEIKSRLSQTSLAILTYGQLYLMRAKMSYGIERKINLIKSAVLMFAAKSRYEMISNPAKVEDTINTINDLYDAIFDNVGSSSASVMRETTATLKRRFKQLREAQKTELTKLKHIKTDKGKKETLNLQKQKIEIVKGLLEKNAKDYAVLMYYIAGKCLSILGKPPCVFAMAGLGSLARSEITLYSDFKYIILLKDKFDCCVTSAIEYFRWFAVLFQIIIIGLGETPITRVRLKGLNDVEEGRDAWFHDVFTPSGVAIDGLMPLVYKEYDESAGLIAIELIQPVSAIVSYLYTAEDNPDGFMLKSLLRQHCFVYGSEEIYDKFSEMVREILPFEICTTEEVSYLVSTNIDQLMNASPILTYGHPQFNQDSFFYKPISDCLACIGAFFHWECFSGFEILSSLKNFSADLVPICGQSQKCHHLELALAVSCELRLKAYSIGKGSRLRTIPGVIMGITDWTSLHNCMQQTWILTRYLESIRSYADRGKLPELKFCRLFGEVETQWDNIVGEQLNNIEKNKITCDNDKKIILLNCIHVAVSASNRFKSSNIKELSIIENAKRYLLRHPGYIENQIATALVISIYLEQKKPAQALEICEEHVKSWNEPPHNALRIRRYQIMALMQTHTNAEVLNYCDGALRNHDDAAARMTFTLARIVSRIENREEGIENARKDLKDLLNFAVSDGCEGNEVRSMLQFLEDIFLTQYKKNWIEDAVATLSIAHVIAESKVQYVSVREISNLVGHPAAFCCLKMASALSDETKIIEMATKVFDICKMLKFEKDLQQYFIDALKLVVNEHIKSPSLRTLSIFKECIAIMPEEMHSFPIVTEVKKLNETNDTTVENNASPQSVEVDVEDESHGREKVPNTHRERLENDQQRSIFLQSTVEVAEATGSTSRNDHQGTASLHNTSELGESPGKTLDNDQQEGASFQNDVQTTNAPANVDEVERRCATPENIVNVAEHLEALQTIDEKQVD